MNDQNKVVGEVTNHNHEVGTIKTKSQFKMKHVT